VQSLHFHTDPGACLWKTVCHIENGPCGEVSSNTVFDVIGDGAESPLPPLCHRTSGMMNFIHSPHSLPTLDRHSLIYRQRGVATLKADGRDRLIAVEPESASWLLLESPFSDLFVSLESPKPLYEFLDSSPISAEYAGRFIQDCLRNNLLAVENQPFLHESSRPAPLPLPEHFVIEFSRQVVQDGRMARESMPTALLQKVLDEIFSGPDDFLSEITFIYAGPEDRAALEISVSSFEERMKCGSVMHNMSIEASIDCVDESLIDFCAGACMPVRAVVRTAGSHHSIRGSSLSSKALEIQQQSLERLASLGLLQCAIFEVSSPGDLNQAESLIAGRIVSDVRLDFIPGRRDEEADSAAAIVDALLEMADSLLARKAGGELRRLPDIEPLSRYLYNICTSSFRNAHCARHYGAPEGRTVWYEPDGRRIDCRGGGSGSECVFNSDRCSSMDRLECRHCMWRNFCARSCPMTALHCDEEKDLLHCRISTLLIPRLMCRLERERGLVQFVHRGACK